jgi:hypothetical protein
MGQEATGLVRFDSRQADLQNLGGHWLLVSGSTRIKDLGTSELYARQALRLVQELGLNQYGVIGKPRPIMEYWLADGRGPHGLLTGLPLLPIDQQTLRAEVVAGRWGLRDDRQLLFSFGPAGDEVHQALEVLKQYGFNRLAYIGEPVPVMMLFLACPDQPIGVHSPTPTNTLFAVPMVEQTAQATPLSGPSQMPQIIRASIPPPISFSAAFAGSSALPPTEGVAIDWRDARLEHNRDDWTLLAGGRCLAHFGACEQTARLALRLLQTHGCTEFCRAGRSESVLAYFLVNGRAPRGPALGCTGQSFQPEALTVQQMAGGWMICDGGQPLFACGPHFDDAADALQTLQRHQFDHLVRLESTEPAGLLFMTRER